MKKGVNTLSTLFTFEKVFIFLFFGLCLIFGFKIIKKIKHREEVVIELRDKQGIILENTNETFIKELIDEARKRRRERK